MNESGFVFAIFVFIARRARAKTQTYARELPGPDVNVYAPNCCVYIIM